MPEGPEVTATKNALKRIIDLSILELSVLPGSRYHYRDHPKKMKGLNKRLPKKVLNVKKKGKFLYILLESGWSIWFTLGMTGKFIISDNPIPDKHSNFRIELYDLDSWDTDTHKPIYLFFNDSRHFGTITCCQDPSVLESKLNTLGPDILSKKTNSAVFINKLREYPNKSLDTLLLDQKIISGIGNYIRAEALYKARLYPFYKVKQYTNEQLLTLFIKLKEIGRDSLLAGGTTLTNFEVLYEPGYYYLNLHVYCRKTDLYGNRVTKTKSGGRNLHWVEKLQM